jgi:uncharacterized membrane protein YhhN
MNPRVAALYGLFGGFALADIALILSEQTDARYFTKPFLAITLLLAFRLQTKQCFSPLKRWLTLALFCSFLGDTCLLLESRYPAFFIAGLSAFLLAHVFYIRYFIRVEGLKDGWMGKNAWTIVLLALYGLTVLYFLFPGLGSLQLPVILYMMVLFGMLITCINARPKFPTTGRRMLVLGAIAFVVSDSILAFSRFYADFPLSNILVMTTYCLAQYLITRGSAAHLQDMEYKAMIA